MDMLLVTDVMVGWVPIVLVVSFGSEVLPQLLHLLLCITNTAADAGSDNCAKTASCTDMLRADALGLAGEHID